MLGPVQRPAMADQTRMPFTMAVMHEVQRFGDLVPLGIPHMTSRDIEVQGFLIPKVGLQPSAPMLSTAQHGQCQVRAGTQGTQSSFLQAPTIPA